MQQDIGLHKQCLHILLCAVEAFSKIWGFLRKHQDCDKEAGNATAVDNPPRFPARAPPRRAILLEGAEILHEIKF